MRKGWFTLMATILVLAAASPGGLCKEKGKQKTRRVNPSRLMLSENFGRVDPAELALEEVPFAPDASAVVLLDAWQQDFKKLVTNVSITQNVQVRRWKILEADAIEEYGSEVLRFDSHTMVDEVLARTILPDGTVVDAASGIHRDRSSTGKEVVSISFPQVRVGAILERIAISHIDGYYTSALPIQERLPVMESRFIFVPPPGLTFSVSSNFLTPEEAQPIEFRGARGPSYIWRFTNLEPILDEPNQPPLFDMTATLYVIPTARTDGDYHHAFATDWEKWNQNWHRFWKDWMARDNVVTRRLAAEVTESIADPREKVDALRQAVMERIRVGAVDFETYLNSPDQAIRAGSATTAEIAATFVAMLRAVDIDADLMAFRRRTHGEIPEGFPIPALMNDTLVRVRIDGVDRYMNPTASLPLGTLPGHSRGVLAMALDGESTAPVRMEAPRLSDYRRLGSAILALDSSGNLSGEVVLRYMGSLAEEWRSALRDVPSEEQEATVRNRIRRHMSGALLDTLEIEHLDDLDRELVVRATVRVEGYATVAGRRMLINPNVLSRVEPQEWAADSRTSDVDLRHPLDESDVVTIRLPDGVTVAELPAGAKLAAGDSGDYTKSYKSSGTSVIARRQLRLKRERFPARMWLPLQSWFLDMAGSDDEMLVLNLP